MNAGGALTHFPGGGRGRRWYIANIHAQNSAGRTALHFVGASEAEGIMG